MTVIAVLIPCYNEEVAISRVVHDFRAVLPDAAIYVYDNNSHDGTVAAARAAGATVRTETLQGKGHVIRRMFADIDADLYVLVDGDDTYDAAAAPLMIARALDDGLDMVNGTRITVIEAAYRRGHRLGNQVLTGLVRSIFGNRVSDMLSGYRVFSRRFVKSFPALSSGFETETEFTVHALELRMPIGEVPTSYKDRPAGSTSKLRTYSDGLRILRTILVLVKEERPLPFFTAIAALLALLAAGLSLPLLLEYSRTGLVPRLPTAVLAVGLMILAALSTTCGLILDSVSRGRKEIKRLAYLAIPAPPRRATPEGPMTRLLCLFLLLPILARAEPPRIVGGPGAGCIAGAVQLPLEGPGYETIRMSRSFFWGHPDTIAALQLLAARARAAGLGTLYMNDISKPHGGPFPGIHASHMLGLDADVWLDVRPKPALTPAQRDTLEVQSLVRADGRDVETPLWSPQHVTLIRLATELPGVDRILVNAAIKQQLCRDATGDRTWLAKVRPWYGHGAHMHIHFRCMANQPECVDQPPVIRSEACDASLQWWFDQLDAPHPTGPQAAPRAIRLPVPCAAILAGG